MTFLGVGKQGATTLDTEATAGVHYILSEALGALSLCSGSLVWASKGQDF